VYISFYTDGGINGDISDILDKLLFSPNCGKSNDIITGGLENFLYNKYRTTIARNITNAEQIIFFHEQ